MDVLKIRLNILAHITVLLLSTLACALPLPSYQRSSKRQPRKMSGQEPI